MWMPAKRLESVSWRARATARRPTPRAVRIGVMATPRSSRRISSPTVHTTARTAVRASPVTPTARVRRSPKRTTSAASRFAAGMVTERTTSTWSTSSRRAVRRGGRVAPARTPVSGTPGHHGRDLRQQTRPGPRRPRLPSKVPRDRRPVAVPRIPRAPGRMSGSLEPYGALVGVADPPGRGGARRRGHALWPAPGEPVPARRDRREDRGPRRKGAPEAARGGPGPPDGLDASGRDGGDLHAQRGGGRPARRRGRYAHAGASRLRPLRGRSVDPARAQAGGAGAAGGTGAAAGRLAVADPFDVADLEQLRGELISIVSDHLGRLRAPPRVDGGEPFHFIQSHVVEIPTGLEARTLAEFRDRLAEVEASAIYYHTVLARARLGRGAGDFAEIGRA